MECRVWSVECEFKVKSVDCKVWSVECEFKAKGGEYRV